MRDTAGARPRGLRTHAGFSARAFAPLPFDPHVLRLCRKIPGDPDGYFGGR
jgi:hypothetical protein